MQLDGGTQPREGKLEEDAVKTQVPTRSTIAIVLLVMAMLACSIFETSPQAPAQNPPTSAPAPTEAAPPAAAATKAPAPTLEPAAAQPDDNFQAVLDEMMNKGYIETTEGTLHSLEDYSEESAKLNWYSWGTYVEDVQDFVFSGHFNWSTAVNTNDDSGCGVVFGVQPNEDHYAAFVTNSRIYFLRSTEAMGSYSAEVGKTKGTGRVSFDNPAEADFVLAVNGKKAYAYVNQKFIGEYTLSNDQFTRGAFGLTLLSGTNKDYGTRCEATNLQLLVIQ